MHAAADIAAEMDEGLKLLFQRGLELALTVQEDALAAEEPERRAKLALSFHRLSRSVRQTAALRMRLAREAEKAAHEHEDRVRDAAKAAVRRRCDQLKDFVERPIDHETDDSEEEAQLEAQLEDVLVQLALEDDFTDQDFGEQVMRICVGLGLNPPPEFSGSDEDHAPPPSPDAREHRSSA